jgi:hypothetical protein
MPQLDERVAALATMSPAQIRGEWLQTFRSAAPDVGHRLLALAVAHRLQEKALGGLTTRHAREIDRLTAQFAKTGEIETDGAATLKTGTRLVREWQGKTHQVLITDTGYIHNDKPYSSLSQVARAITGSNWSGPRFFGLRRRTRASGQGPSND